ncbi:hypothetical protein AOE01nite_31490 [Acetobacter oeni]|uniref:Uncharacterized protein n=1 Tax=Acetobacter oeni TaxID=304077 RepID=A0A511XPP6_9PROT|nr:hypothetical protein AOE01nite_31490 [Acetobacter oeni]
MTGNKTKVVAQDDPARAAPPAVDMPAEPKKKKPKTAPNPKRQKEARQRLDRLFSDRSNVWVIHYSCESFYDRPNGASHRSRSAASTARKPIPSPFIRSPNGCRCRSAKSKRATTS